MWSTLAILIAYDGMSLRGARLSIQVQAPVKHGVGDLLPVTLRIHQAAAHALYGKVRLEVSAPLEWHEDVSFWAKRGEHVTPVHLSADRRGEGYLLATWVELHGPCRLLALRHRFEHSQRSLRILPNTQRVRDLALHFFGFLPRLDGLRQELRIGDGREFDSLEPYVPGMDTRSIDWKASARRYGLITRRLRLERNQRVILCVDTGRLMADPLQKLQRLDHAIHNVLLLAYAALQAGDLVGLYAYDAQPRAWLPPKSHIRHLSQLVNTCASLRPQDQETNHVLGLSKLLTQLDRRSLVIVFSEFIDATSTELMVESLKHLLKKHILVFSALSDPLIEHCLDTTPVDQQALAKILIADGLKKERQRVLTHIRRLGAHVVHEDVERSGIQLLRKYLSIKRRGFIG